MADTLDLPFVQNETFTRVFDFTEDGVEITFAGWKIQAQVREKEDIDSTLILDLSPYITIAPDFASATLRVPARVTAAMTSKKLRVGEFNEGAPWDMFLVDENDPDNAFLFTQGLAFIDPAATKKDGV